MSEFVIADQLLYISFLIVFILGCLGAYFAISLIGGGS